MTNEMIDIDIDEDVENEDDLQYICKLDDKYFLRRNAFNFIISNKYTYLLEGVETTKYANNTYFTDLVSAINHYIEYCFDNRKNNKDIIDALNEYKKEYKKFKNITKECSETIMQLSKRIDELQDENTLLTFKLSRTKGKNENI